MGALGAQDGRLYRGLTTYKLKTRNWLLNGIMRRTIRYCPTKSQLSQEKKCGGSVIQVMSGSPMSIPGKKEVAHIVQTEGF